MITVTHPVTHGTHGPWSATSAPLASTTRTAGTRVDTSAVPAGALPHSLTLTWTALSDYALTWRGAAADAINATVSSWPTPSSGVTSASASTGGKTGTVGLGAVASEIAQRPGWDGDSLLILTSCAVALGVTLNDITVTGVWRIPPTPAMTSAQVAPRTIRMTQTGDADSWTWDYGQGPTTSTTHTWSQAGTYSVTLAAVRDGITRTITQQVTVTDTPSATLTAAVTPGTQTVVPTLTVVPSSGWTAAWDWGDGESTTQTGGTAPTHTYAGPGTYQITVTVTLSGRTHQVSTGVEVAGVLRTTVRITTAGLRATFEADSTPSAGSELVSWQWSFGDGATATGPRASHDYAEGVWAWTLTVTDTTTSITRTGIVNATPTVTDPALLDTVGADRHVSLEVDLLDPSLNRIGAAPIVIDSITCDGSHLAAWSASADILTAPPVTHRDPLHWLARTWVRVWWTIRLPDGRSTLRLPVCTLRLGEPSGGDSGIPTSSVQLVDPLTIVQAARWTTSSLDLGGMDASHAVAQILADRAPWLRVEASVSGRTLPAGYRVGAPDGDPMADISKIAEAHALTVRTNPLGVVEVGPQRLPASMSALWEHGPTCRVHTWQVDTNAARIRNRVHVYSTTSTVKPQAWAQADDDDPQSPTWVGYGEIRAQSVGSDAIRTKQDAERLARQLLAAGRSHITGVTVTTLADPRLTPGHLVAASHPALGVAMVGRITQWTLTAVDGVWDQMSITMQEAAA